VAGAEDASKAATPNEPVSDHLIELKNYSDPDGETLSKRRR